MRASLTGQKRRAALHRALRRARISRGLKQIEVAHTLGVPQSFVSKYESGKRALDLIDILQVCAAIGITLENLLLLLEIEQSPDRPR